MRPLGLCRTFVTTPPFPAPSSANLSKSSVFNSPIFLFSAKNASSLSRCNESNSSSSNFFRISSTFCEPMPAVSLLVLQGYRKIKHGELNCARTDTERVSLKSTVSSKTPKERQYSRLWTRVWRRGRSGYRQIKFVLIHRGQLHDTEFQKRGEKRSTSLQSNKHSAWHDGNILCKSHHEFNFLQSVSGLGAKAN